MNPVATKLNNLTANIVAAKQQVAQIRVAGQGLSAALPALPAKTSQPMGTLSAPVGASPAVAGDTGKRVMLAAAALLLAFLAVAAFRAKK